MVQIHNSPSRQERDKSLFPVSISVYPFIDILGRKDNQCFKRTASEKVNAAGLRKFTADLARLTLPG
jgi:hypothetical protein